MNTIQDFSSSILAFINSSLIPFALAIAFLFFLWNVLRFFIIESNSQEGRTKAKRYITWSIIAFVIILSIWAIVSMLVRDFGFDTTTPIVSDYVEGR